MVRLFANIHTSRVIFRSRELLYYLLLHMNRNKKAQHLPKHNEATHNPPPRHGLLLRPMRNSSARFTAITAPLSHSVEFSTSCELSGEGKF